MKFIVGILTFVLGFIICFGAYPDTSDESSVVVLAVLFLSSVISSSAYSLKKATKVKTEKKKFNFMNKDVENIE